MQRSSRTRAPLTVEIDWQKHAHNALKGWEYSLELIGEQRASAQRSIHGAAMIHASTVALLIIVSGYWSSNTLFSWQFQSVVLLFICLLFASNLFYNAVDARLKRMDQLIVNSLDTIEHQLKLY
jgi:Flp pilus assembly protein TadB